MRKLWAFGAVILLLLASCGGGSPGETVAEGDVFDGTGTTPPPGAIPTTTPAADAGSPAAVPGEAGQPPAGPAGATARPRPGASGAAGGGAGADPRPTLDARRAQGPTGSFAATLLREDLTVEVLAQSGAQPTGPSLAHLLSKLSEVAGRSVGTSGPVALQGGAKDWTAQDLVTTADRNALRPAGSATMRTLFLRGTFEGRRGVLGVAVRGDVLAIFIDSVRSTGGLVGDSAGVERAVMLHEAGHLLGLVDLFLDTNRGDPEHPGHSPNKASVMYWAVESDAVATLFGANPPDTFDAADRADLARIKAGN